jgi:hypothetical protein
MPINLDVRWKGTHAPRSDADLVLWGEMNVFQAGARAAELDALPAGNDALKRLQAGSRCGCAPTIGRVNVRPPRPRVDSLPARSLGLHPYAPLNSFCASPMCPNQRRVVNCVL